MFGALQNKRETEEIRLQSNSVMAGTAGTDPQKQFQTLIRSFAAEKSQGGNEFRTECFVFAAPFVWFSRKFR